MPHGGPLYMDTIALRDEVLRAPLGLVFSADDLGAEAADFHLAAFDADDSLIACMVLTPESDTTVRMRQVAVRPELQRSGIGSEFVEYSERFASECGFSQMTLHARDTAVPFYERLGYERYGEEFEEVTIPHWKMHKSLRS